MVVTEKTRPTGDVFAPTLCHDDEYEWNGVTYSIANGNVVVGANADVVYPNGAACDEKVDTLRLTVLPKPIEVITDTTICHGESITWIDGNVYNSTIQGKSYSKAFAGHTCDSIVGTLNLTVLPEVGDSVEYDTICPGETLEWHGKPYTEAGTYHETLTNENGCEYTATLHLHIPDPDNYVRYDHIPAVSKYGNRLLVVNLNAIDSIFGWTPAEADVQWFKVVGEVDKATDALDPMLGDDEPVGNGYYYTFFDGSSLADDYYALILHDMVEGDCEEILRTTILSSSVSAPVPQLVPTIASPNADLRLLNLNPSAVTEIRVYNTTGDLQAVYTASEVADFMFKAATISGYYMVEVQSDGEKVTLRYIVK